MEGVTTSVNRLKLGLMYNIGNRLGLSIAPSLYYLNNETKDGVDNLKISSISPVHTKPYTKNRFEWGWGISVGLHLRRP